MEAIKAPDQSIYKTTVQDLSATTLTSHSHCWWRTGKGSKSSSAKKMGLHQL